MFRSPAAVMLQAAARHHCTRAPSARGYDSAMLRGKVPWLGLIRIAAWILVALIAAVTLVPIGLRPVVTAEPSIERFAAYALAGC